MERSKVLIVEDHPIFSKGLASLIGTQPSLEVCAEAQNRADAISAYEQHKPDLVIVDLNLGGEDGLDVVKDIHTKNQDTAILVLSMHDEKYYAERALKAGARGYIMKEESSSKVLEAARTVLSGKTWLSDEERRRIEEAQSEQAGSLSGLSSLSDRQMQIFTMLGKGLGTIEIASRLNLSTKTVDAHKEHIKQKLYCGSSQELREMAVEWNSHNNFN
ncbi:MAG: response regulator transcription factor [Treponema sp.]|nr:response regulator transcription factor [Treponema sp.]